MQGYLRTAVAGDVDLLYEWVNETDVRKSAFQIAHIPYQEHIKWYEGLLGDSDRKQYIYMYGNEPVGQVRIEVCEEIAEVDYSISVTMRGKGHGKNMLCLLREQIQTDFPKVEKIRAKVKAGNIASRRVFSELGYAESYISYEFELNRKNIREEEKSVVYQNRYE